MPVVVYKHRQKPIVFLTYSGLFSQQDALQAHSEYIQYRTEDHITYLIADLRTTADLNFEEVMRTLKVMQSDAPGYLRDPQFRTVLVGNHDTVRMVAEAAKSSVYGSAMIPVFASMDEALTYIDERL